MKILVFCMTALLSTAAMAQAPPPAAPAIPTYPVQPMPTAPPAPVPVPLSPAPTHFGFIEPSNVGTPLVNMCVPAGDTHEKWVSSIIMQCKANKECLQKCLPLIGEKAPE